MTGSRERWASSFRFSIAQWHGNWLSFFLERWYTQMARSSHLRALSLCQYLSQVARWFNFLIDCVIKLAIACRLFSLTFDAIIVVSRLTFFFFQVYGGVSNILLYGAHSLIQFALQSWLAIVIQSGEVLVSPGLLSDLIVTVVCCQAQTDSTLFYSFSSAFYSFWQCFSFIRLSVRISLWVDKHIAKRYKCSLWPLLSAVV